MITVTENAIEFIHHSIKEGSIESELGLRVAIKEASDGGYDYGIGFDEKRENDIVVSVGRGMIDEGRLARVSIYSSMKSFVTI